jgi:CRISPR-associated protein Cmr6
MSSPQRIAALPNYINSTDNLVFADAAPGHRFQLYFRSWRSEDREIFSNDKEGRAECLKEVCKIPPSARELAIRLNARQSTLIQAQGQSGYTCKKISTAPFATGLGNEHPSENGFAFLTPYGLPYLAGSGIKGVLRHAAEELAFENTEERADKWTWLDICWLFGFEGTESPNENKIQNALDLDGKENYRGALDFWDCFPQMNKSEALTVEVITPHFTGYYQHGETPHDAGQPKPVYFLALPSGSLFNFHVVCHQNRLPQGPHERWKQLLDVAFEHACEWIGFGAKTSVGYGALNSSGAQKSKQKPAEPEVIWEKARLKFNPRNKNLTASGPKNAEAHANAPGGEQLLQTLPAQLQQKVRRNDFVQVVATVCGNTLVSIKTAK